MFIVMASFWSGLVVGLAIAHWAYAPLRREARAVVSLARNIGGGHGRA